MSKLFSCDYDHYNVVKCRRNMNFEEIDTEPPTWKNDGFWLLWGIWKEFIKQNSILAVIRKPNAHSVAICRLIKKINNRNKKRSKEKNLFPKFPRAYEVLTRRNII